MKKMTSRSVEQCYDSRQLHPRPDCGSGLRIPGLVPRESSGLDVSDSRFTYP